MSKKYISMKYSRLNLATLSISIVRKDIHINIPFEWILNLAKLTFESFYVFSSKSMKFSMFRIRAEMKFIYIVKVFVRFDQRSRNGVNDFWKV